MDQTDFLMRQINQLTDSLKNLLTRLLKIKDGNPKEVIFLANENCTEILGKNIQEIAFMTDEAFAAFIKNKKTSLEAMKHLSEILQIAAELFTDDNLSMKILSKSLMLYEQIACHNKSDYSIELNSKIESVKNRITK